MDQAATEGQVVEQPAPSSAEVEKAADADFSKGFDKAQGDKLSPDAKTTEKKVEQPAPAAAGNETTSVTEVKTEVKTGEPPAPKGPLIAGMTEDEFKAALAQGGQAKAHVDAEVRKVFSKIGEINRTVQELAKNLSAGKSGRKITAEALKRVNEELPGLGDALAQDLSEILGGTEVAQAAAEAKGQVFDPEAYHTEKLAPALQAMEARIAKVSEEAQTELLEYMHPDFETVLKTDEFKAWLLTLAEDRRKTVVESPRAVVAGKAITEFKEWREKAAKEAAKKKSRLEGAVTPQGTSGPPGQRSQDDDADFNAGFNRAKKKA